ncbi:MAG: hypothetical protein LBK96_02695 [Prevotellaceae bacterium]|jgi:multidrug efflux pump subunit AcrA (membrane-fusion protein)|nr:hypothetical protein [Prevotellaceae bacterium]
MTTRNLSITIIAVLLFSGSMKAQDNQDLKAGMYATAVFGANENDAQSIVINRKALVGGMKDPHVFIVRDSRAYKIPVQTGQADADYVEIIEGISVDDVIVITGQINLKEGSEVSVLNS